MRRNVLFLCIILIFALHAGSLAVDVMLPVPTTDPAYAQLRQLNKWGVLTKGRDTLLDEKNQRELTRYDVAFMLVESLERCTALVEVQKTPRALPEERRRAEMACFTFSQLDRTAMDTLVTTLLQLVNTFGSDIDHFSPGLSRRADAALRLLMQPEYRPWQKNADRDSSPVLRVSIRTPYEPDSLSDPWLVFSPARKGQSSPLFLRAPLPDSPGSTPLIGTRGMSSLAAAADVAFGRFKLYGTLATLPGDDPARAFLNPDGNGKAMLGIEIGLMRFRDISLSGILEYHIVRTGDDASHDTSGGALGGVGITW